MKPLSDTYVEETRLGFWFLRSHTWQHHVLRVAINDLRSLFSDQPPSAPVILDAGCGQGKSFQYLHKTFAPKRLIGLDADPLSLQLSGEEARRQGIDIELIGSDCAELDVADASVDILFCHQTFHHLVEQERALEEFWRVLKPGGLLFAPTFSHGHLRDSAWKLNAVILKMIGFETYSKWTPEEFVAMIGENGFAVTHWRVLKAAFPLVYLEATLADGKTGEA